MVILSNFHINTTSFCCFESSGAAFSIISLTQPQKHVPKYITWLRSGALFSDLLLDRILFYLFLFVFFLIFSILQRLIEYTRQYYLPFLLFFFQVPSQWFASRKWLIGYTSTRHYYLHFLFSLHPVLVTMIGFLLSS